MRKVGSTYNGGHRWCHMTMNLVECVNSVLKGAHNLPITALVRATYFRLTELFARKSSEAHARKNARHIFSEAMTTQLQSNEQASRNLHVSQFDSQNEAFHVQKLPSSQDYRVDLRQRYCDYSDFKTDRYPCRYVIGCYSSQNVDWQAYVDDVYRISEIFKIYKMEFEVVGNESIEAQDFVLTPP